MKTIVEIDAYEIAGEEIKGLSSKDEKVKIESHWNYDDRVVVKFRDVTFTVLIKDLKAAIAAQSR